MKRTAKLLTTLLVLTLLLAPAAPAAAAGLQEGRVLFGETFTLASGETLDGDLVVIGGSVSIEDGASVTGSLVLVGGSLDVQGSIARDVVVVGSAASLGETARVGGDVITVGTPLRKADGAQVGGSVITNAAGPRIELGSTPPAVPLPRQPDNPEGSRSSAAEMILTPVKQVFGVISQAFLLALLAALLMLFLPVQTERVGQATITQPLISSGLGCLTIILAPIVVILLTLTLLLIPVAVLAILALSAAVLFGWIAVGAEVGFRMLKAINLSWPQPLAAALGTFVLSLVALGIGLFPCVGWLAPTVLTVVGLGGVLMTRFGSRVALPPTVAAPVQPAPPPSGDEALPPAN